MSQARVFVPQDAVENWLGEGRASISRDVLGLDGFAFWMTSAVRFLTEVTGAPDAPRLVGRVKTRTQLEEMSAEHTGESVVLGDNAYEVVEGYLLSLAEAPGGQASVAQIQKLFATP